MNLICESIRKWEELLFILTETIFYDAKLYKQPLEPYNFPLIPLNK
jgi:hypothetical protein